MAGWRARPRVVKIAKGQTVATLGTRQCPHSPIHLAEMCTPRVPEKGKFILWKRGPNRSLFGSFLSDRGERVEIFNRRAHEMTRVQNEMESSSVFTRRGSRLCHAWCLPANSSYKEPIAERGNCVNFNFIMKTAKVMHILEHRRFPVLVTFLQLWAGSETGGVLTDRRGTLR